MHMCLKRSIGSFCLIFRNLDDKPILKDWEISKVIKSCFYDWYTSIVFSRALVVGLKKVFDKFFFSFLKILSFCVKKVQNPSKNCNSPKKNVFGGNPCVQSFVFVWRTNRYKDFGRNWKIGGIYFLTQNFDDFWGYFSKIVYRFLLKKIKSFLNAFLVLESICIL